MPVSLDDARITDRITEIPLRRRFPASWVAAVGITFAITGLLAVSVWWLLAWGVGVWGINIPVAWGFAITNFVWWIGIGHAGTLISAILLLLRQRWRNSISRFAEAMTLFAVANAGIFPLLHLGRPWRFYYLLPYPDTLGLWPQWRSPLVWDVIAVSTYFTVSLLFWYLGLVPDMATMRDAASSRVRRVLSGVLALGWNGSAAHWQRYQMAYLLLAGLATPLVVSVHSIVSLDFAVSIVPGWHSTIFPPYFVAGAVFSGFAMVLTLAIPLRAVFHLEEFITPRHLNSMAKVTLTTALIVAYGYLMEDFTAWYSGDTYELSKLHDHLYGANAPMYWTVMFCNVGASQLLWFRRVRVSPLSLFCVSIVINIGMWLERYDIVIGSLRSDFLPSAFGTFSGTFWDWSLFIGTMGFFLLLFCVFIRLFPMMSMFELREQAHHENAEGGTEREQARPRGDNGESATHASGPLQGIAAEFVSPSELLHAAPVLRGQGFADLDGYTPFPVEGLSEALGQRPTRIAWGVLLGALAAGAGAYWLMWYSVTIDYPWNIGGRPPHSIPSFIPITFELAVLGGALAAFFGVLFGCRLPRPYNAIFNTPGFERASRDRFFLVVRPGSEREAGAVKDALRAFGPVNISEVRGEP